jgi:hypothetical protein
VPLYGSSLSLKEKIKVSHYGSFLSLRERIKVRGK